MKPVLPSQPTAINESVQFYSPEEVLPGFAELSTFGSGAGASLSRVIESSRQITRSSHLTAWLQGELQELVPHQVMIVAWGDFRNEDVRYYALTLPGSDLEEFPHKDTSPLLRRLYARWIAYGRRALGLSNSHADGSAPSPSTERLPRAFSSMRSLLVHGLNDEGTGRDRLYVTMHADADTPPETRNTFQALTPCIDRVLRRISTLRVHHKEGAAHSSRSALSEREREILDWISKGKTNQEIASILSISPFTVKNHLQRIFRKLDVLNRAQATAKFAAEVDTSAKVDRPS